MLKGFFGAGLQRGMLFAVGGLLLYIGWLHLSLSWLEADILEVKNDLIHEQAELVNCKAEIKEKNDKALVAEESSKKFKEEIDALELDIANKDGANSVLLDMISKDVAPETCGDIGAYLRKNLEDLKW